MLKQKKCGTCKLTRPISEFNKNKYNKDGLQWRCTPCRTKYNISKKHINSKKHKEYYKKNSESVKARCRDYYNENKEKVSAYQAEYFKKNKRRIKSYFKKWSVDNKDKMADYRSNRYYRELRASLTREYYDEVNEMVKNIGEGNHLDHIIALGNHDKKPRGLQDVGVCGLNVPWNMQVITKEQNQLKNSWFNSKKYAEWLRRTGGDWTKGQFLRPRKKKK